MIKGYNFPVASGAQVKIDGKKYNGQLDLYTYYTTLKEERNTSFVPKNSPEGSTLYRDNKRNSIYIKEKKASTNKQYNLYIWTREHNKKFDKTQEKEYIIEVKESNDIEDVTYKISADSLDTQIQLDILISYNFTDSENITKRRFKTYRINDKTATGTISEKSTSDYPDVVGYSLNKYGFFVLRQEKAGKVKISQPGNDYWFKEINLQNEDTELSTHYIYEVVKCKEDYYLFYQRPAESPSDKDYCQMLYTKLKTDEEDWSQIALNNKGTLSSLRRSHVYVEGTKVYYMNTQSNNVSMLYKIDIENKAFKTTDICTTDSGNIIQTIYFDINNEPLYLLKQNVQENKDIKFDIGSVAYGSEAVEEYSSPIFSEETSVLLLTYSGEKGYTFEDYEVIGNNNYTQIYFQTLTLGSIEYYEKYIVGLVYTKYNLK